MALGSFVLIGDQTKIMKKVIYNHLEQDSTLLNEDTVLKIRMRHQSKSLVLTIGNQFQYLSYVKQIDVKRDTIQIVGGIILSKEMNSAVHQDAVEMFTERLISSYNKNDSDLLDLCKKYFQELFDQPQLILDRKELEKRLSERVKSLNKEGNFDEAKKLLNKIEKIPLKLYAAHEIAERSMNEEDFDRALKEYQNAKRFAMELEEAPLIQMYSTKIKLAKKTPSLLKKREKLVKNALDGLRSDNFTKAQKNFKRAAEVSERLMDPRRFEEFSLKAQALAEYVKVEKKYK